MRIAVIGAGITGLTLAAAMRRFDGQVDLQLYERDAGPTDRFQGYSLGMKGEWGIPVLRRLDLFDQLRPDMARITNFVFGDQRGHRLLELPSGGDDEHLNLRIKRSRLKEALRAAAPDVKINFGMECTGYRQTADEMELQFRHGQAVRADYVVAADGVASALRQQLVGDRKRYLGLTSIVGEAPITLEHPLLDGGGVYCSATRPIPCPRFRARARLSPWSMRSSWPRSWLRLPPATARPGTMPRSLTQTLSLGGARVSWRREMRQSSSTRKADSSR